MKEMSEELLCNICSDPIEGHVIRLSCEPDKHYFCESCITDWYKKLKEIKYKSMYNPTKEYIQRMCPICRRDGGLLPLYKDTQYIPSIHQKKLTKEKKPKKVKKTNKIDNNDERPTKRLCNHSLKNSNKTPFETNTENLPGKFCKRIGIEKYEWLCFQHRKKTKDEIHIEDAIEEMLNPPIQQQESIFTDEEFIDYVQNNLENINNEMVYLVEFIHKMNEKIEEKNKNQYKEQFDVFQILIDEIRDSIDLEILNYLDHKIIQFEKYFES
jgi:hypothetical protein